MIAPNVTFIADTGVDIRVDGCRYLGAAIGTPAFLQSFLDAKAESWLGQVERLSDIAQSQPQAAYSAFTNGLQNKWSFLCRTMPNAATALAPVEKIIADKFIHAITGRLVNAEDRALLALSLSSWWSWCGQPHRALISVRVVLPHHGVAATQHQAAGGRAWRCSP